MLEAKHGIRFTKTRDTRYSNGLGNQIRGSHLKPNRRSEIHGAGNYLAGTAVPVSGPLVQVADLEVHRRKRKYPDADEFVGWVKWIGDLGRTIGRWPDPSSPS